MAESENELNQSKIKTKSIHFESNEQRKKKFNEKNQNICEIIDHRRMKEEKKNGSNHCEP